MGTQSRRLEAAFLRATREDARGEQSNCCYYCRWPLKQATADHRIPRKFGGGNQRENIVAACFECNVAKGHMPEGIFKNAMKHPPSGSPVLLWLAWSRRRIALRLEKMDRVVMRACGIRGATC